MIRNILVSSWPLLILSGLPVISFGQDPAAVLSISSIDELLADADLIADAIGQPNTETLVLPIVNQLTGGQGFSGIDTTRRLGAWVTLEDINEEPIPVYFIPVADEDAFLGLLKKIDPEALEEDGKWKIIVNGMPFAATIDNGYFFLIQSTRLAMLDDLLDPEEILNDEYDVAVDLNLGVVPVELKEALVAGMYSAAGGMPELNASADKFELVSRDLAAAAMLQTVETIVNQGETLTLGINIDGEEQAIGIDLQLSGMEDSPLAAAIDAFGRTIPRFDPIVPEDTLFAAVCSSPTGGIAEKLTAYFSAIPDHLLATRGDTISPSGAEIVKGFCDLMSSTIDSGIVHSAFVLESDDDNSISLLAAAQVASDQEAGTLLRNALNSIPNTHRIHDIRLDAEKSGKFTIHSGEVEWTDDDQRFFADSTIHFAAGAKSLWCSAGKDNLAKLKAAMKSSSGKSDTDAAPVSVFAQPAAMVMVFEKKDQQLLDKAEPLAGGDGDFASASAFADEGSILIQLEMGIDLLQLARN